LLDASPADCVRATDEIYLQIFHLKCLAKLSFQITVQTDQDFCY